MGKREQLKVFFLAARLWESEWSDGSHYCVSPPPKSHPQTIVSAGAEVDWINFPPPLHFPLTHSRSLPRQKGNYSFRKGYFWPNSIEATLQPF